MKVTDLTRTNHDVVYDAQQRSHAATEAARPFAAQRASQRIAHLIVSIVAAAASQTIRAAAWTTRDDGTLVCTAATDTLVIEGTILLNAEESDKVVARRLADATS